MKFNIKNIKKLKESMSKEQKKRLLLALKNIREEYTGNIGGETDIQNADCLVSEEDQETNIIAKTFDTKADFDSYVNQFRGIQMTPKEQQSIIGYKNSKPVAQDKFFVKYETSDNFGNNNTTVIKKLREGSQFCWTALSKNEPADSNPEKSLNKGEIESDNQSKNSGVTVLDTIRITKTITFVDDIDGANILGDFLRKLEV